MSAYLDQRLGPGFVPLLVKLSAQQGIDPKGAAAVMLYESGLKSAIVNSIGAVGLNQLVPANYGVFAPLSLAQYRALTPAQQLPYVFKFWSRLSPFRKGATFLDGRDLYWLNFLPATFVPGAWDSHVIATKGSGVYAQNAGLDHGGKGYIDAGDFWQALAGAMHAHPQLWNALSAEIGGAELFAGLGAGLAAVTVLAGLAVGATGFLVWEDRRRPAEPARAAPRRRAVRYAA